MKALSMYVWSLLVIMMMGLTSCGDDDELQFSEEQLAENYKALYDVLVKARPNTVKGTYLKSVTVSTTMGPGIKVSVD